MQLIGATLERVEPGAVDIALPFRDDLTQQHAFLHGAVTTAIADSAAGYAALSLMPAGNEVLSVEFKINLLRPAVGSRFIAEGRVVKAGKTITVSSANVFAYADDQPVHIATLLATMISQKG
ncbi:MAG: PaaI family thioesterase [Candidatus Competibacteraceae bacterium]|nr:PaaI family thioesterase [Candidatus Competibacteraceae bacterium]